MKIKITEYLPRATTADSPDQRSAMDASSSVGHATTLFFTSGEDMRRSQPFGVLTPSTTLSEENLAARGQRLFTIQRVNGNGGNGKADGIGGGHRHTLVESDSVKKNSVQRYLQKKAKDEKRVLVSEAHFSFSSSRCKENPTSVRGVLLRSNQSRAVVIVCNSEICKACDRERDAKKESRLLHACAGRKNDGDQRGVLSYVTINPGTCIYFTASNAKHIFCSI